MPNLAVFYSEPLSNSGSSGWEERKYTADSACYIFTVGKRKGNLLDPVWCVGGGGNPNLLTLVLSFREMMFMNSKTHM